VVARANKPARTIAAVQVKRKYRFKDHPPFRYAAGPPALLALHFGACFIASVI
jgi:hypothetical protein